MSNVSADILNKLLVDHKINKKTHLALGKAIDRLREYENFVYDASGKRIISIEQISNLVQLYKEGRMVILPASPGQSFWKIEKFCNEGGNLPGIMNRQGKSCEYCYMPCNAELRIVEYHFPDVKYILDTMDCIDKTIFLSFEKAQSKLKEPNSK